MEDIMQHINNDTIKAFNEILIIDKTKINLSNEVDYLRSLVNTIIINYTIIFMVMIVILSFLFSNQIGLYKKIHTMENKIKTFTGCDSNGESSEESSEESNDESEEVSESSETSNDSNSNDSNNSNDTDDDEVDKKKIKQKAVNVIGENTEEPDESEESEEKKDK